SARLRLGILAVVVVSLFSALLARLWYLQVLAAPTYKEEAQLNSVRFVYTEAPRGRILDRNGKVLVGNRVVPTVVVDKSELGDKPDDVIRHLSALVKVPESVLRDRIEDLRYSPFKPIPVADDVPKEILIHIREHQDEYPGVQGVMLTKRAYPFGSLAAHVLGYVGEINDDELNPRKGKGYRPGDSIGKSGVELAYEDELRGQPQVEKLEVDAQGKVLRSLGDQPAVQGHDVRLTIDLDLQKVAEDALVQSLTAAQATYDNESAKRFLAPAGSAVVIDPRDGSVLAMASFPTYNPADFVDGISVKTFTALQDPAGHYPLNNRVTQGLYAPASTFKLVTSIAGLETGLITPQYTVNDRGSFTIGDPPVVLKNAFGEAFGYVNLASALTVSSDVFFYELGSRFCPGQCRTSIQETAKELGMGDFTDIELPFEASGRIPDEQTKKRLHASNPDAFPDPEWYTGDNLNLAIGQGDTVITPLQLVNAYATLANGGTVYAPHVGDAVLDVTGAEVRRVEPRVNSKTVIPPTVRDPVVAGFEGAVANTKGTAAVAFTGFPLGQFPIAGKTGTAQVSGKQDTALFAAFGPVEDPRYAVTVVMEEAGFGAAAAAPVARRIFDQVVGLPITPITRVAGRD
ncbi:MAG: penicillin-binding protein 2, partial [Actinomycetota bacterium]|nr:penicillin-binding protein 2 [Actinomycetota bacterium]